MNWFRSFLGLDDKKQALKTAEVANYLDQKHILKRRDIKKIQVKAIKVSKAAIDLKDAVEDIVNRMAIIASGRKYNG
jgi:hypothetical protein